MNIVQIKNKILEVLESIKGENIVTIDLNRPNVCYDVMILVNGRSNTHNIAIAHKMLRAFKCADVSADSVEGLTPGHWIVISNGSVVLHIFQKEVREYYDLEGLWQHVNSTS